MESLKRLIKVIFMWAAWNAGGGAWADHQDLRLERCFQAGMYICQFKIVGRDDMILLPQPGEKAAVRNRLGQDVYWVKEASMRFYQGSNRIFITGNWLKSGASFDKAQLLRLVISSPSPASKSSGFIMSARKKPSSRVQRVDYAGPSGPLAESANDSLFEAIDHISGSRAPSAPVVEQTHQPKVHYISFDL